MKEQAMRVRTGKSGLFALLFTILLIGFGCSQSSSSNEEPGEEQFTIVEERAKYPGGIEAFYQYLTEEIRYPVEARTEGITGQVWMQFTVDTDGSITEVQTVKGIGGGCGDEAARVISGAKAFEPAQQRGRAVRVRNVIPIIFQLKEGETNPDGSPQGMIIVGEIQESLADLKVDATFSDGEWSGTIYDEETGDALPGANIVVKGTTNGTVSDLDGSFTVKAEGAGDIVISFIGYESVELQPEQQ